jgi:hypothetical protein
MTQRQAGMLRMWVRLGMSLQVPMRQWQQSVAQQAPQRLAAVDPAHTVVCS